MKQLLAIAFVALACVTTTTAQNRKLVTSPRPMEPRTAGAVEDASQVSWGFDFSTALFFRGMRRETQGAIFQPHLEVAYGITEGEGELGNVDVVFGFWNSLHDGPTGTRGGNQVWYESDFYLGGAVGFMNHWSSSLTYTSYSSPNGVFANTPVQELTFAVSFDDSFLWEEADGDDSFFSGLNPSAAIGIELDNQADFISSPSAQDKGAYGQFAVAPEFSLGQTGDFDWTLATPVTVGFSLGDYYEDPASGGDKVLGFIELGSEVSSPFPYFPSRMGPWEVNFNLSALILGSSTETMNGGDAFELVATIGMSTTL